MVAFNFKKAQVEEVESGKKCATIRPTKRAKPGDTLQLYTGLRTKKARLLINDFLHLPFVLDDVDYSLTFDLAEKHYISVYDASYVALAKSKKAKLLSLDKKLQKLAA